MRLLFAIVAVAWMLVACERQAPAMKASELSAGAFHVQDLGRAANGWTRYLARTDGGAAPCEFEILLSNPSAASPDPVSFGSASLVRRPGADCTVFLQALGPALAFHGPLPAPSPSARLDCSVAFLGSSMSRNGDAFAAHPAGTWLVTKLFLADGEGEVFLDLDPAERVGEFALKDEDDAQTVMTELARVLLPERHG